MHDVRCIWPVGAELGEGPVWVEREKALYFVDIMGCLIHRRSEGGETQSWAAPGEPGFVFPCQGGGFICGLRGGLHSFDPTSGAFTLLVPIESDKPRHRINDGLVEESGRLWFGTMHEDCRTRGGALYSWKVGEPVQMHDAGYIVTNGPALSPDRRTLYHTDSTERVVYAFDLSHRGTLSNKRPFVQFSDGSCPDGMAVDRAGNLWIALFNGWRLELYSPQGRKIDEVVFPCANVTKPAFGGDDLHTLYVTTAWTGQAPESRATQRLAGGLFAVDLQTPGLRLSEASTNPSPTVGAQAS